MASLLMVLLLAGDPGAIEAAEQALNAGKPAEALRLLGDLAKKDDVGARVNAIVGRAYVALKEYEAAVEPLLRASDSKPDDRKLARDAAMACWYSANGVYARAYLEDAMRMAKRADDALLMAHLRYAAGDYALALEGYRAQEDAATNLEIAGRIGDCLGRIGNDDDARTAYAAALEEALKQGDVRQAYAFAFRAERPGRLLQWLDQAIAKDETNLRHRLYRGYTRAHLLMHEEAATDLRIVVEAQPDNLGARTRLAEVLAAFGAAQQRDGEIDEAETFAREILAKNPRVDSMWKLLQWTAWRHFANRRVERSCDVLKFMHGLDPEDLQTGLNFGAMSRRLGRYDEAEAAYRRLLEAHPDDPAVVNDLGIVLDGRGDRAGAVKLWEAVLEEDPEDKNALENLFTDAWERGDEEAVEEYLRRGTEMAKRLGNPNLEARWRWFRDRTTWVPAGHGG